MTDEFLDIDISNVRRDDQRRKWTPDRERELRGMVRDNDMSCGQMAAQMGISRNACIGKIHRMGLSTAKVIITDAMRLAQRAHRLERKRTRAAAIRAGEIVPRRRPPIAMRVPAREAAQFPWKPRPRAVEPAGEVSRTPVDITALTATTCRWPLWRTDAPFQFKMYCGNDVVPERVYCRVHMLMRKRAKGEQ